MKKILLITGCILQFTFLPAQELALTENVLLAYSGYVGVDSWYFPREAPIKSFPEFVNTIKGRLDLSFQFDMPLGLTFNQRFQMDAKDNNRNRYEIEDLALDYFTDTWELKAGLQIFSWKTVESISHADFLNQTDLESDFLDADKLSELSLRFRYIPESETDQVFEFYYLPYMRPTRFPVKNNRFSFPGPAGKPLNISNDAEKHLYQDSHKQWRPQFAVCYLRPFFESVDTRWFYFNGYNRFPGLLPDQGFTKFYQQYRPVHKAGLTFQGQLNSWLLKGEIVYTNYQKKVLNQKNQTIQPAFLAYTFGFEYTFYSLIRENHDVGTILEIIGDSDSGKDFQALESFRPFQNHLFGGMRYTFNNTSDRSILMGGFYNYMDGDIIFSAEYSERFLDVFTFRLEYMDLTSDTPPISQFEHADRLIVELLYNF